MVTKLLLVVTVTIPLMPILLHPLQEEEEDFKIILLSLITLPQMLLLLDLNLPAKVATVVEELNGILLPTTVFVLLLMRNGICLLNNVLRLFLNALK